MQENLVHALRSRLPEIRAQWTALLHVEPISTPLAHPHSLVHLFDWTLHELFQGLTTPPARCGAVRESAGSLAPQPCPCGRNPLLVYFAAGEQAMREALVLAQAAAPALDPIERDRAFIELDVVFSHIAQQEIESFCAICQYRASRPHPGFVAAGHVHSTALTATESSSLAQQPSQSLP